jgi:Ca2+-transporting ATPase
VATLEADAALARLGVDPGAGPGGGRRGGAPARARAERADREGVEESLAHPLGAADRDDVLILVAAAALSAIVGDWKDASVILANCRPLALLARAGVPRRAGDGRPEAAAVPVVRVRRDGEVREVPASDLVSGDIVLLEAGNLVPADARVIGSATCASRRRRRPASRSRWRRMSRRWPGPGLALGDRRNIAYMGTTVTYGRGQAIVVATRDALELGRIATLLQG